MSTSNGFLTLQACPECMTRVLERLKRAHMRQGSAPPGNKGPNSDSRAWPRRHLLFVDMVRERMKGAPARQGGARAAAAAPAKRLGSGCRPADLPVVGARA
jgi:hypothetical protein